MTQTLTLSMVGLIGFCILTEGACQLCFKQAANASTLAQIVLKPVVWLGILFWGVEVIAWINVLERVPLSIAFPTMALSYVTTMLAGAAFFKENLSARHAAGALLITAGVACVGATGI